MEQTIWSIDWGTSGLRVRLADLNKRSVIAEIAADKGAAAIFDRWNSSPELQEQGRPAFYLSVVHEMMQELMAGKEMPAAAAVVISGMATSSIGILDVPYAALPFSLHGENASVRWLPASKEFPYPVMLISGVAGKWDVMRGEETQLTGLFSISPKNFTDNAICILPGTHSKHASVHQGSMVAFSTYMTGELFQLLIRHSILKDVVTLPENPGILDQKDMDAFLSGVQRSEDGDLLHRLFTVRVNRLFQYLSGQENYYYLSGLLIGTELRGISQTGNERIVLCCGNSMFALYRLALEGLDLTARTVFVDPGIMDTAVVQGHIDIFRRQMPVVQHSIYPGNK